MDNHLILGSHITSLSLFFSSVIRGDTDTLIIGMLCGDWACVKCLASLVLGAQRMLVIIYPRYVWPLDCCLSSVSHLISLYRLCLFPIAAIINHHKFSGIK